MQVAHGQLQEEATGKATALEAQAKAAREEAARAEARGADLAQQLEAARDAVKVRPAFGGADGADPRLGAVCSRLARQGFPSCCRCCVHSRGASFAAPCPPPHPSLT
jgi:hypothetical protein